MKHIMVVLTMLIMVTTVDNLFADNQKNEIELLKELVTEQQKTINELQTLVQKQNERIQFILAKVETIEVEQNEEETRLTESAESSGIPGWIENVKLGGDFRLRYENIDDDDMNDDRNRGRIRARLKLDAEVNDEIDLHFRFATGSDDPVSTNQTFDDAFSSKSIWLDHAYFDYQPEWLEGLSLLGGKMKNPYFTPGGYRSYLGL